MKNIKRIIALIMVFCLMTGWNWSAGEALAQTPDASETPLTITKVEDIGNHAIRVYFSEPIAAMSSYPQMGIRIAKRGTDEVPMRKDAATTAAEWMAVSTCTIADDGTYLTYTRSLSPTLIDRGIAELAYRGSAYVLEFAIQDFAAASKTNDAIDCIVAKADANKKLQAKNANGSGVERAVCEITLPAPRILSVQQINTTQFKVNFSQAVTIVGAPNMGFRIVKKADMSVATRTDNGGVAQWIATTGYTLAQDGLSLIYTANTAQLQAMKTQLTALGTENYAAKFVIVESGGTDDIYAGGGTVGVKSADGSKKLLAGFFRSGSNGFATCDITDWSQPKIAAAYHMSDTQFDLVFPGPTAITPDNGQAGARIGLFVIDKTTMKLASFNGGFRQYFSTSYTWNADQTRLTWNTSDGVWAEASAAAATNENYEVVFGIIDATASLNGVMNNMTLTQTGEYYVGNAVGSATDRLYVSIEEPTVPTIEEVRQIGGDRKYKVTFSEAVDINGTPNIGFAVVDENDLLGDPSEQFISTDAARIEWADDHRSLVWTATDGWYTTAVAKAQARGENYRVRFVIVDASGTKENRVIDNVVGRAFRTKMAATYSTGAASERVYADITVWTPATITQVKQLDRAHFRVSFSEAVDIVGTPNIGLAVVDANYVLGNSDEQYISTSASRITWAADHTSFVWKADETWYNTAVTKAQTRGDGYSVQFAIIENGTDKTNQTVDNLISQTSGDAAKATTYSAGANARMYHSITPAAPSVITQVMMVDDDTFRIIFDRPTQIVGTPNIGLAVVKKGDNSLGSPIQQHISKETNRISWSADGKVMTWSGMDNIYKTALAQAAARGSDYTVRFFFGEDGSMDQSNYTMDHLVSVESGDAIAATTCAAGTNARVYADITAWNPPTITNVVQSSETEFAVHFSDAVYINGTPNIGFAIVKAADNSMNSQYIDTASSRYSWSADHKTLYWNGGMGWWDAAMAKLATLGADYKVRFVFVENAANMQNGAVDNLTDANGQMLAATTASTAANARLYADITLWEGPYIERIDQKTETKFCVHFSEPVNIAKNTRVGMFVIDTTTHKLVNFVDSIGYRQIFTSLQAQSNVTELTFELADNRLAEYKKKAGESPNYAVVIGFIDLADSGQNGAINAITAVADGDMLVASGYEGTDRVYQVPVDVSRPYITSAKWKEGATFVVTFSEPVTIQSGTRMGLFVVDRRTGRLANFGTTAAPTYEQMFNADRYEWVDDTTLLWTCGGSYADIAGKAAIDPNFAVQFGIIDTAVMKNGVVDCIVSRATGEALAGNSREVTDRAYSELFGFEALDVYVGTTVSPSAESIEIDGTVKSGEWGDAVIVTNPVDAQVKWNGWIAFDPDYVDYNQAVKIYMSNDDRYIYVAATLDHAAYYAGDSDLISENVNFIFTLSRYEEETTFARVHSLRKQWERYTSYAMALVDGQPVVRCVNQKINYEALTASDYAVRYDDATDTYHYEIRIPYKNTNIDPAKDQIGFSAMLNVGRADESLSHNCYHITKGCARRGGAENFAHVDQVIVLKLNETPINPEAGNQNIAVPMLACLILPPIIGVLLIKRRRSYR